ncbi:DUF2239 family protein [Novosphingobium pokkalii]|uniref:DUF2239 family protein n=1 Tax=Novosphingobium pokkalii TaxID=1770194 RepID=A0ABV7V648_9SPHN|nr:DUF2239 family protein [Novosphingobium pokkalii]GHD01424.1 hypothetical protein GCM10019060_35790 [Novosphingobium pokkalii]
MSDPTLKTCTAFVGHRLLLSGLLPDVAQAVRQSTGLADVVLVFDDATGRIVDLDLRGSDADILERISQPPTTYAGRYRPKTDSSSDPTGLDEAQSQKTRGRPKLGVVAREVTLLPRQWDWLTNQPGGASATLRRLVDEARKTMNPRQQRRAAQEAAYQFMQAIAGDMPGYEDATRALFADDRTSLEQQIATWPDDIRTHALRLAFGAGENQSA